MKYLISYVHRKNEETISGEFEFKSKQEPKITDMDLIEELLKNTSELSKSGIASLSITSISLLS